MWPSCDCHVMFTVPDPVDTPTELYSHWNWRIYVALCAVPVALVLVFFIVSLVLFFSFINYV